MRAALFLATVALLLPLAAPPAAASSTCNGTWTGSDSCTFVCDSETLSVEGHAQKSGTATVTVTAECGFHDATGGFVAVFSVSCSASGAFVADCSNSGSYPYHPAPLAGRCTVTGSFGGSYACASS